MPAEAHPLLERLADRVRTLRTARAMTLRELSESAGVSQRFLVSLEAGKANISVVRLDDVARALDTTPAALLDGDGHPTATASSEHWVALLGLRGAGKSAIGERAAQRMGLPFVELDARIGEAAGMSLEAIFSMHGADYYRRLEADQLRQLLDEPERGIVATGGGIVTHHDTYELLKRRATTVWLAASPEDHYNRVVAQGDVRPMANRSNAMAELRSILRARRALYEQAESTIDTTQLGLEKSVDALVRVVRQQA